MLNSTLGTLDSRCEDCQENRNTQGILGLWVYALEGNPLEDQALGPSQLGNQSMKSDRLQLEKSLKEEFRGINDQISGWEDIHVTQFLSQKQRIEVVIATLQAYLHLNFKSQTSATQIGPYKRFPYFIFPWPLQ